MAMPPTRRRSRKPNGSSPAALAARLPNELKTFNRWRYGGCESHGLVDYSAALTRWLEATVATPVDGIAVMDAAGLTAADWYRQALAAQPQTGEPPNGR
jgi:hypothetical protein